MLQPILQLSLLITYWNFCCNIKFYYTSSRMSQSCDEIGDPKSGPEPELLSQDQFLMYMISLNNEYARLLEGCLFKISESTVTRCLITWTNLCYFSLVQSQFRL